MDELDESESNEESTGAVEALERDDMPGVSDSECRCSCAHANGRQLTDTRAGTIRSGVRRCRSVLRTRRRAERPDDDELFPSDAADDTNGCRGRAAAELGSAAGLRPLVPSGPIIKAARSGATRRQRTTRIRMGETLPL